MTLTVLFASGAGNAQKNVNVIIVDFMIEKFTVETFNKTNLHVFRTNGCLLSQNPN